MLEQKNWLRKFKLKIGLINLGRILSPGEEVMGSLGEIENKLIQEENKVYFQDVHDQWYRYRGDHYLGYPLLPQPPRAVVVIDV